MKLLLSYKTNIGTFYIGKDEDNGYHPLFEEEDLGSYVSMWMAVDYLTSDTTTTVQNPETKEMVDTSTLGIPEDYLGWERMKG